MSALLEHVSPAPFDENAYYRRLGGLMHDGEVERYESEMRMPRARQVYRTWRAHVAWHLANALGWRP